LILVQRFRGTMDDWDPDFLAPLTAGRKVIRFDNPGVGETPGESFDTVAGMSLAAIAFPRPWIADQWICWAGRLAT
jgi:pimeloyl-ACP methyl ester carboxylesterase